MVASKCGLSAAALALLLSRGALTLAAEPATRAELSALLDTGNLWGPREAEAPFWETLGSLRSGRDERARLGAFLLEPGVVPGIETSACLRLELGLAGVAEGTAPRLSDASSWVQLAWQPPAGPRLRLRGYPFDTDYVRLGYLHSLDWGGTRVTPRESVFLARKSGAPGFIIGLDGTGFRLFAGIKWARPAQEMSGFRRTWGGLLGGGARLTSRFRVEAGFGFFERQSESVERRPGFVEGASMRWVWHRDVDEPEVVAEPFRTPSLRDDPERLDADLERGAALALEGALLVLRASSEQRLTSAMAAAVYGSMRGRVLAGHFALSWRSLAFVLRNDARYDSASSPTQPELAAWLGGSATLRPLQLVPSVELGVRLPSILLTPSSSPGVAQVWTASEATGLAPLPLGGGRRPVLATRVGLRWQASFRLALVAALDYQRDPTRTRLIASPTAVTRSFDRADSAMAVGGVHVRW